MMTLLCIFVHGHVGHVSKSESRAVQSSETRELLVGEKEVQTNELEGEKKRNTDSESTRESRILSVLYTIVIYIKRVGLFI